ncbi:MAG: hypothetical protein EA341_14360 [Mongoliibacter sp.]|uniref:hypothetical protein n=1 Tax=Mongoliibacter sp. TaxID=2022438 RepID=UPI0012F14A03|nr:hypothetical protein [Mongoliibacter sp.]TVP46146.1 MAG: hypothetical protein EA341_14360 [Mongoliibacter sp.]
MNSVKKVVLGLISIVLMLSCQEVEEPVQADKEIELEKFQRFDNFNFRGQNSNVTRIRTIGDRLYYAHRINPGYLTTDLEAQQLSGWRDNLLEFRQSLSSDYIAAVDRSLRGFNIYDTGGNRNLGFLSLDNLLEDLEGHKTVSLNINSLGNFEINDGKMLANIHIVGSPFSRNSAYIFDLEKNTIFNGVLPNKDVLKVDFPENTHRSDGDRIFKVNAFRDGWIASASTGDLNSSPNYLISKDGSVKNFTLNDRPNAVYMGHEFTSDGKLIMNVERHIYISESGKVEDLKPHISIDNFFNMRLIDDRMVIWNNRGARFYEVENFDSHDPEIFNIRKLNNEGIEKSGINELELFNGKVFAATSQGLFTKSLENFWDSAPEPEEEDAQGKAFLEGIELLTN